MMFICNTDPENGFCAAVPDEGDFGEALGRVLAAWEQAAIRSGFYVRVDCTRHGGWQCYLQLDGSHISSDNCACDLAGGPLECPIEFHRVQHVQSMQDWSDDPDEKTTGRYTARGVNRGVSMARQRTHKGRRRD